MKVIFLTFLLVCFSLIHANAQVSGAAALIALDEIDASVSKHLQSINNLATNAIGNTGNMILSASARLRKDINETIGNTDQLLREQQVILFNNIQNTSNEFNDALAKNIQNIDVIANKLTSTIDDLGVDQREPRVFKYDIKPFIKKHSKDYSFKITGKNFDKSESIYIRINNKEIKPIQLNYSELLFNVDSSDINQIAKANYIAHAQLVFNWTKGLFKTKKQTVVPFIIPALPHIIGDVTVHYDQPLPERRYTPFITYSCECSTGTTSALGSRRRSSTAFNLLPTGGRLFDTNTITDVSWTQRFGGGHAFTHTTEQQIAGRITCKSEAQPRGGGGYSAYTFKYKEYDIIYPVHKKETPAKKITPVNPVVFDLPNPEDNKNPNIAYAKIKTFDNQEIILVPNTPNPFFTLSINAATNDIVVLWKR